MNTSSRRLTLSLASHLIASGRITQQELVSYCHALAVAGEERWNLNAFTRIFPKDFVMEQAIYQDNENVLLPLSGIPISVKANVAVKEAPLTASSKMLSSQSDDVTCGYDAQVVRHFKDMGAVVIGITQMDEFGMGSLGTNLGEGSEQHGDLMTKNPLQFLGRVLRSSDEWVQEIKKPYDCLVDDHSTSAIPNDVDMWYAGGSSCGSAASVSHGSSLLSVASDTGGSIRLPAAWCGVTGFKPSYGRLSRKGLVSYASSLDTVGFLTPTAECASLAFDHLNYAAKNDVVTDSTMVFQSKKNEKASKEGRSLRVGIPSAFSVEECPQAITDAWEEAATALEQKGATLVELPLDLISPELIRHSLAAYYILASAEASSNLSRYDGLRYGLSIDGDNIDAVAAAMSDLTQLERRYASTRSQGFGREVVRRILSGTSVLSSDRFHTHYEAAMKVRAMVAAQFREALQSVDVLMTPTCLSLPNKTETGTDPTGMFVNDVFTVPISLASMPAISIPWQEGSPVGVQIVGDSDDKVLEVAATLEQLRFSKERS